MCERKNRHGEKRGNRERKVGGGDGRERKVNEEEIHEKEETHIQKELDRESVRNYEEQAEVKRCRAGRR